MKQETKVALAVELFECGAPKANIARQIGVHKETVGIWLTKVEAHGLEVVLGQMNRAKKGPRRPQEIKNKIFEIPFR